jgi:hypothetical protein
MTSAPYFVRNDTLLDNMGLERLEVFFRNATSVSFECVSEHPNYSRFKNLHMNPGEAHNYSSVVPLTHVKSLLRDDLPKRNTI